jgi:Ca-activated chloride channel family protein
MIISRKPNRFFLRAWFSLRALSAAAYLGCSAEGTSHFDDGVGNDHTLGLDPGVGIGGSQDFGQFRQILENGELPVAASLDQVGFFNEHKIPLPAANCGRSVCAHALVGSTANMINGGSCTMVFVGMNTPVDLESAMRPPLHLAIAIDTSGSMAGEKIEYLKIGLARLVEGLAPNDLVSLIPFSEVADVRVNATLASDPSLHTTIAELRAEGATNVYDGLRRAYEIAAGPEHPAYQARVILLTDGQTNQGVQEDARLIKLARAYADHGITVSSIGVGTEFDPAVVRGIAQAGEGSFYFAQDPRAVEEIFAQEAEAFLVPIGTDAHVQLDAKGGFVVRGVYGVNDAIFGLGSASLDIPRLQLAHRQSLHPDSGGRRGGGGALIFELLPTQSSATSLADFSFSYTDAATGQGVSQFAQLVLPIAQTGVENMTFFSDAGAEKAFVMLNIYVAFKMASEHSERGNLSEALNILEAIAPRVEGWLQTHLDGDIQDDLVYINLFRDNLIQRLPNVSVPQTDPGDPWPVD